MKKKVVILSDHALSTSGVGVQTRHLIQGLLDKYPGEWSFRQFGAAVKHTDYSTVQVSEDFIIKPIDGFGDRDLIRVTLATEKPDLLLIFTDPRFFIWLFEMEDEIHQICPLAWWHVWDNYPRPTFNDVLYKTTDLINCHSYLTYEICNAKWPEKTNFVPHSLPPNIFYEMPAPEIKQHKAQVLGPERADHFVAFWMNRNAKRKRPGDLLESWQFFLKELKKKHGHTKATLLLHTDPLDPEGPNLYSNAEMLGIKDNVVFSTDRIGFEQINVMHNISDCCINISYAEGFGLATLEAMQTGTPIIATKTGGLTRQVIDHRDGTQNGLALDIDFRTLVGSQGVPYIYEDYATNENIAKSLMQMYEAGPDERRALGQKAKKYVEDEFSHKETIRLWHDTMTETIANWKTRHPRFECIAI